MPSPYRRDYLNFIHVMASSISFHGRAQVKHLIGKKKASNVTELLNDVRFLVQMKETAKATA